MQIISIDSKAKWMVLIGLAGLVLQGGCVTPCTEVQSSAIADPLRPVEPGAVIDVLHTEADSDPWPRGSDLTPEKWSMSYESHLPQKGQGVSLEEAQTTRPGRDHQEVA